MRFYLRFLLFVPIIYTQAVPAMQGITPPRQFCLGKEKEQKHPDPTDCGYFYFCGQSYSVRQRCAPGTFFHEFSKTCEFPENVPSCVEQLYGDAKVDNSHNLEGLVEYQVVVVKDNSQSQAFRKQTRQAQLNNVQDTDKGSNKGTNVNDLTQKDQIDFNGGSFQKDVSGTENVNHVTGNQDAKDVVFEGRIIPKEGNFNANEQLSEVINGNHHESQDPFCVSRRPDHYPDPGNCEYFYQCSVSLSRRHRCAPGTVFNPKLKFCDHPGNVPSCANQEVHVFRTRDWSASRNRRDNVMLSETVTGEARKVKIRPAQDLPSLPEETNIWGENGILIKETPAKKKKQTNMRIVIGYKEVENPKSDIVKSETTRVSSSTNTIQDKQTKTGNSRFDLKPLAPSKQQVVGVATTDTRRKPISGHNLASLTDEQLILLNRELRKRLIALKVREQQSGLPQRKKSSLFENFVNRGNKPVLKRTQEGLLHPDVHHFLVPLAGTEGRLQWYYPIPLRTDTGKLVWRYLHVPRPFARSSEFRTPTTGQATS